MVTCLGEGSILLSGMACYFERVGFWGVKYVHNVIISDAGFMRLCILDCFLPMFNSMLICGEGFCDFR